MSEESKTLLRACLEAFPALDWVLSGGGARGTGSAAQCMLMVGHVIGDQGRWFVSIQAGSLRKNVRNCVSLPEALRVAEGHLRVTRTALACMVPE